MKKFSMIFFWLTVTFLMTTFSIIKVEAADVPDFRQINYSQIKPSSSKFSDDFSMYYYICGDLVYKQYGLPYAKKYVELLTRQYPFKIVKYDANDLYTMWLLVYTGNKNVKLFNLGDGNCHIYIEADEDTVQIYVAKGLSYAGHFIK